MRSSIKQPTPEVYAAIFSLEAAVDAHLSGDRELAANKFKEANCPATWQWLNHAWTRVIKNVVILKPEGDTQVIPKTERDPDRNIQKRSGKPFLNVMVIDAATAAYLLFTQISERSPTSSIRRKFLGTRGFQPTSTQLFKPPGFSLTM